MTRLIGRLLLAILVGALLAGAWLNSSLFVLSLLGYTLLICVSACSNPRSAMAFGFFAGWFGALIGFYWAAQSVSDSTGLSLGITVPLSVAISALESTRFVLFAFLISYSVRFRSSFVALAPAFWVTVEFLIPAFLPWTLGATPTPFLIGVQSAELSGQHAVSFVYCSIATLPVLLWQICRGRSFSRPDSLDIGEPKQLKKPNPAGVCIIATIVLLAMLFGADRLYFRPEFRAAAQLENPVDSFRVAAIQIDPSFAGKEVELQEISRTVAEDVDLICWPELSIGNYRDDLESFHDEIAIAGKSRHPLLGYRPLSEPRSHLLAGGRTYGADAREEGPYHVSAFLIDEQERIAGRHHKRLLMPIGEYVPFEDFFPFLRDWAGLEILTEPGERIEPLIVDGNVRIGIAICFEDMYPQHMRKMVQRDANVLVALVNGSTFGDSRTLKQHFQLARLRAVENRRWFVRCSATGVTCAVSPAGEVVSELPTESEGVLLANIAAINSTTIYTRYGDWLSLCCLATTCFILIWLFFRGRRANTRAKTRAKIEGSSVE